MSILNSLNEIQLKAVKSTLGPNIILAGAGSGKTHVLVSKVAHLIKDKLIDPSQIIMITFTNKAAREMQSRIAKYLDSKVHLGFAGTFHSFCVKVLREYGHEIGISNNFLIYTQDDATDALKIVIKKLQISKITPSYFLYKIGEAKSRSIKAADYINIFSDYRAPIVAQVYSEYEKFLKSQNALDFDDLLLYTKDLLRTKPLVAQDLNLKYSFVFIDEFQDTNTVQYAIARSLAGANKNITVVGDFSQAIYSFRGADITNLQKFTEDFPDSQIFYLEQNYRSTSAILDYAYNAISANTTHPILKLFTKSEVGQSVLEILLSNEEEEAIYVCNKIMELSRDYKQDEPYANFAILYRTNAQSRSLEEAFLHYNIPYTLYGGVRFYERKEIKDILSYLRLVKNPQDQVATERVIKLGKRKYLFFASELSELKRNATSQTAAEVLQSVLKVTAYTDTYNAQIQEEAARLDNISELASVASSHQNLDSFFEHVALVEAESELGRKHHKTEGVKLMSLHASKGLEFDTVFLVGLEEGLLPHSRSLDDENQLEEERRLFYVGVTRAKKKLFITSAKSRNVFGRRNFTTPSRFLQNKELDNVQSDYYGKASWQGDKNLNDWDVDPSVSDVSKIIDSWDIDPSVTSWTQIKSGKKHVTDYNDDIDF